jgi:hypothetical protein
MGDQADFILEGGVCEQCGVVIDGESPGYPRTCNGCKRPGENRNSRNRSRRKKKSRTRRSSKT